MLTGPNFRRVHNVLLNANELVQLFLVLLAGDLVQLVLVGLLLTFELFHFASKFPFLCDDIGENCLLVEEVAIFTAVTMTENKIVKRRL
jgi:hypothetical protein